MSALLLPVGQSLGALHPGPGLPSRGTRVRVGSRDELLPDDLTGDVWHLAHGVPRFVGAMPWGRDTLPVAVAAHEPVEVRAAVDQLLDRGLLAEVDPADPAGLERFAAGHGWQSLQAGLGYQPSGRCGIGLPGAPPVREVSPRVYEFWSLAPVLGSLADAAAELAALAADTAGLPAEQGDPPAVLAHLVGELHELLCVGAGFLDVLA
jgi:hypothetical protein